MEIIKTNKAEKQPSQIFRLEELLEDYEKSLETIEHVSAEQTLLLKVVEDSGEAKRFKNFIEGMKDSLKDMQAQKTKLLERKSLLNEIIFEMKNSVEMDTFATQLFKVFGIFEERTSND